MGGTSLHNVTVCVQHVPVYTWYSRQEEGVGCVSIEIMDILLWLILFHMFHQLEIFILFAVQILKLNLGFDIFNILSMLNIVKWETFMFSLSIFF